MSRQDSSASALASRNRRAKHLKPLRVLGNGFEVDGSCALCNEYLQVIRAQCFPGSGSEPYTPAEHD